MNGILGELMGVKGYSLIACAFATIVKQPTRKLAMRTSAHHPITSQALNTLVFAGIMLWFVAQQNLLAPSAIKYGPTDVAKAMNLQPRTPPPMFDPEQIDIGLEDAETFWDYWPQD